MQEMWYDYNSGKVGGQDGQFLPEMPEIISVYEVF